MTRSIKKSKNGSRKLKTVTMDTATTEITSPKQVAKPGAYHELLQFVNDQVKPAGAVLFVVSGVRGTGWECMGSPLVVASLPILLRKVADDIEKGAGIVRVKSGKKEP